MLHLHDDLLLGVRLAEDVIHGSSLVFRLRKLLLVHEAQVRDMTLPHQQIVQKLDQQILIDLLTEDSLESPVGKRIDKSTHS